MLGVGVEAVRQSITVDVAAHIDAAAHSTHVHVDCVLLDFYAENMQLCPSCYEELRQQAVLATPVWKRQVNGTGLFFSQVVVLIVEAKSRILHTSVSPRLIAMVGSSFAQDCILKVRVSVVPLAECEIVDVLSDTQRRF